MSATGGDDKKEVECEEVEMKPVPDPAVPTISQDESTGDKENYRIIGSAALPGEMLDIELLKINWRVIFTHF